MCFLKTGNLVPCSLKNFSLQSFRLQMTIENMNHLKFIPHKDYTANRLVSGLLQLPSNTSLVIDETLLEQGQLDTAGTYVDVSPAFLTR